MKNKKAKILLLVGTVLLAVWACDMRLKTVTYNIKSEKIDKKIRVALITDLHGCWYGKEQQNLIKAVEKENPDVVLLGGDIFDDKVSYEKSEETLAILTQKYKCYYVTGNHEY